MTKSLTQQKGRTLNQKRSVIVKKFETLTSKNVLCVILKQKKRYYRERVELLRCNKI